MRRLPRLVALLALTTALALVLLAALSVPSARVRSRARSALLRAWGRGMCAILSIRRVVEGEVPPEGPFLAAANHLGYLDVPVLAAELPCRFVARSDVSRWPFLGWLSRLAGTLFVRRKSARGAMEMMERIRLALDGGDRVLVFPEGTSTDGTAVLPFRPASFGAVEYRDGAPVLPVRLELLSAGGGKAGPRTRELFCWCGEDDFVRHFWRFLAIRGAVVRVAVGEPIPCGRRDRRSLADAARRSVVDLGTSAVPSGYNWSLDAIPAQRAVAN